MITLDTRRPWTQSDKDALIKNWDAIGSIFLISYIMRRTEGAIQTEASRLELPRRHDKRTDDEKHRKKWNSDEEIRLKESISKHSLSNGLIDIVSLSSDIGRTVDAVAMKLREINQSARDNLHNMVFVDEAHFKKIIENHKITKSLPPEPVEKKNTNKLFEYSFTPKKPTIRKCLTCDSPFHSWGAGNRICKKCKDGMSERY